MLPELMDTFVAGPAIPVAEKIATTVAEKIAGRCPDKGQGAGRNGQSYWRLAVEGCFFGANVHEKGDRHCGQNDDASIAEAGLEPARPFRDTGF